MSGYGDGYRLECEARNVLRDNGYAVIRSASSKTPVDLVAFKVGEMLFVQCKRAGKMSPADRDALLLLCGVAQATPLMARWRKDGRAARTVEFAELTGPGPKDLEPWTPDWALETSGA